MILSLHYHHRFKFPSLATIVCSLFPTHSFRLLNLTPLLPPFLSQSGAASKSTVFRGATLFFCRKTITFYVCWLGSVFYFFLTPSYFRILPNIITINNTTQQIGLSSQSQWWVNESINPNCSCTTPWNSTVTPTDRMKCCHRSV